MAAKAYTYRSSPSRLRPLLGGQDVLLANPPAIASVAPTSVQSGQTVTVNGTSLTGTTSVKVNSLAVTFVFVSDTQLTFTVPGGATTGPVTVATPLGTAISAPLTITVATPTGITPPAGFTTWYEDQFKDNSAGHWSVYNNNTFGSDGGRIQRYMAGNVTFGAGSAGSTGGTSIRLEVKRNNPAPGNEFSAGMVDTRSAGFWYPRYGYFEFRSKCPHGHGIWPSTWMVAKNGGGSTCEWDIQEYFHGQIPGKNSTTMHGTNNAGVFQSPRRAANGTTLFTNNTNRTFFEAPTYTPQWKKWATEILPVTDAGGLTIADVTQPSMFVRFRVFLEGVEVYRIVDDSALKWSTEGGTEDSFWNIFIQGSQIDGGYIGHPDGELAYSEQKGICLISGSPGSCTKTAGGYPVIRAGAAGSVATLGTPATTYELDYFYMAKYTG